MSVTVNTSNIIGIKYYGDIGIKYMYGQSNKLLWTGSTYYSQYFTTESQADNNTITLNVGSQVAPNNITYISYSTDGTNWTRTDIVSGTAQAISVTLNTGQKAYWKGEGNSLGAGYTNSNYWSIFSATDNYKVYGNIASFFFGDNYIGKYTMPAGYNSGRNFQQMFSGDTHVTDAGNLIIPFYNCNNNACASMFSGCSALTHGPKFCFETVGTYSCQNMFNGCTSLIDVDAELRATRLYTSCYQNMFNGCTSLTKCIDKLHISNISGASNCCSGMFSKTLITSLDFIHSGTEASTNCFLNMFNGCSQLTGVPTNALQATSLGNSCYYQMFYGCTNLTVAPDLPATTLGYRNYMVMFRDCTSLTTAPAMTINEFTNYADSSCAQMFRGCTKLSDISKVHLNALTLVSSCYVLMFVGGKFTSFPALPATTLASSCYSEMFRNCSCAEGSINLPATVLVTSCYKNMLANTKVNEIRCMANTGFDTTNCLYNWVAGVPSTGTFTKAAGVTWPSGASGIPTGWTVQEI